MHRSSIRPFLILSLCTTMLSAACKKEYTITWPLSQSHGNTPTDLLRKALPETCTVGSWICTSDVPALQREAYALLAFSPGQIITQQDCIQQFDRWEKQQRFVRAEVSFILHDTNLCDATIHFIAGTVVESITISGTLIGKDKYRHSYVIKPGELFTQELHNIGLQKIQNTLHEEGFWGAVVHDELYHDADYRTVRVVIHLQQGTCYKIASVRVAHHTSDEKACDIDQQKAFAAVKRLFSSELEKITYDTTAINNALSRARRILLEHGFMNPTLTLKESVDHDRHTVALIVHLDWGIKNIFIWYGNRFFSNTQLLDHLLNFDASLTLIPPALIAEELITLYKQHGFWDIRITWREDGSRTYFFINEGKQAIIDAIELQGVTYFNAKKIIKMYGQALIKSCANEEKIKKFLTELSEHYMHLGFWDVAIEEYNYIPIENHHYTLVITLHEGSQRWLSAVTSSLSCLPHIFELLPSLNITIPQPFDVRLIKEQRHMIIRALRQEGKLYARPIPELHEEKPNYLRLHWTYEGLQAPVRFGKTIVTGNGTVDSSLIARECSYQEGETWDPSNIELTISRLRSLGIFDVVSLVPDDISVAAPTKDLVLQCVPDTSYEIRSRLGIQGVNRNVIQWNGGASPKIGLSFMARNPARMCDLLRMDFDYTRYMHDVVLQYKIPWIGHYRPGLELQAISSRYDQPVYIGSPAVLYRASHDGIMIGCGKNYGSLTGGASASFAQIGLKATRCDSCSPGSSECCRALIIAKAIDVSPRLLQTKPWYIILEGTCMIDSRDDKVNPHAGSLTVCALKGVTSPTLSSGSFIKGLLEHSWFISWADVVFGLRCRVGMIGGAQFDRIMPMERFYLGGPYSLRCYESDYAPPLASFLSCSGTTCLVPTGGKYMINTNLEIRFPIYKQLSGVLFIDGGSLSCNRDALVCPNNFMGAAGFGLRVNTPVGPLRGDFGWRLHHERDIFGNKFNSRRFAWFITLGQAF